MTAPFNPVVDAAVLGGGLTGLSAGYSLSKAGMSVAVLEGDSSVGGLSRTIEKDGFRFDLGGHRFFSTDEKLNSFVRGLMGDELVEVARSSKILMNGKYFNYPLSPVNAFFGLGVVKSLSVIADYLLQKAGGLASRREPVSLEDWVIRNFGRTMFEIYFKVYSEKVWGIDCSSISAEWVDRRINGLSLGKAVANAFSRAGGRKIPTLVDRFFYPDLGIGRISDRLKEEIEISNNVLLDTRVEAIYHDNNRIDEVLANSAGRQVRIAADRFISSLPLNHVIKMLRPAAPEHILSAASALRFRDLVVVAVMVDKERVTDQTWIYVPDKEIPFGRIHEPTNWSAGMAPEGKTILVMEFFCFAGDRIWNETDPNLTQITVDHLEALRFLKRGDVSDSMVVRVPRAYPLFEIGYQKLCGTIYDYLARFSNLHVAGRSGMFRYYNMDHAIESGLAAADAVIEAHSHRDPNGVEAFSPAA